MKIELCPSGAASAGTLVVSLLNYHFLCTVGTGIPI